MMGEGEEQDEEGGVDCSQDAPRSAVPKLGLQAVPGGRPHATSKTCSRWGGPFLEAS